MSTAGTAEVPKAPLGQETYFAALSVRRALTVAPTGPIKCQELKLLYVNRGRTRILHDSGSINLLQGSFVLLPADRWYIGEPCSPVETLTVYLDPEFVHDQIKWLPATAPFLGELLATAEPKELNVPPRQRAMLQRYLNGFAAIDQASPNAELHQFSRLASTIALLHDSVDILHPASERGSGAAVDEAIRLFEDHLQRQWSIQQLAGAVSVSASQLTRLFTQQTGSTPSRFLRESRAHRMRELLRDNQLSVSEAGKAVGWNDPSHATRSFRAIFGYSPRQA